MQTSLSILSSDDPDPVVEEVDAAASACCKNCGKGIWREGTSDGGGSLKLVWDHSEEKYFGRYGFKSDTGCFGLRKEKSFREL